MELNADNIILFHSSGNIRMVFRGCYDVLLIATGYGVAMYEIKERAWDTGAK